MPKPLQDVDKGLGFILPRSQCNSEGFHIFIEYFCDMYDGNLLLKKLDRK